MTSKEKLIATLQPNLGYLKHVETNPTNTACVFLTEDVGNIERYIFQDMVYERDYYIPAFSLSFDGKKLAIISPESDRIGKAVILINGEVKYNTGLDTVYCLQWLSNDELAWYGCNESEDRNERTKDHGYFINGQDMTDRFEFECFYGGSVMVKMDNFVYCIDKNGNQSQSKVANGDRWNNWGFSDQTEKVERPQTIQVGKKVAVNFNATTGPLFDEVGLAKDLRTIFVDDKTLRPYYVGMRYSRTATLLGKMAEKLFEKAEEIEDRKGKIPFWGWPLAYLFGPYSPLPLGSVFMERSKRYYPVNGNQVWGKGYHYIDDYLLTPTSKMVVVAHEGKKAFVVIDEKKVSSDYDSVYHCVYLPDEGICFIGRKDDNFFRVVVN